MTHNVQDVAVVQAQNPSCFLRNDSFRAPKQSCLTTPLHAQGALIDAEMAHYQEILARLRQTEADAAFVETYSPAILIQRRAAHELTKKIAVANQTADSTKAMCKAIVSSEVGFVSASIDGLKRYTHKQKLYAPDMEPADNALQHRYLNYEFLDISTTHSTTSLMHTALLDAMHPHTKLYLNVCLYGYGETGKDFSLSEIKNCCSVPGTVVVEGYRSALADLGFGNAEMHKLMVQDEALDNLANTDMSKGRSMDVGNKSLSIEKRKHTENILESSTLQHVDGVKVTVKLERGYWCPTFYISNLDSMQRLTESFKTRLILKQIAMVARPNPCGAADKNAFASFVPRKPEKQAKMRLGLLCSGTMLHVFLRHFAGVWRGGTH